MENKFIKIKKEEKNNFFVGNKLVACSNYFGKKSSDNLSAKNSVLKKLNN